MFNKLFLTLTLLLLISGQSKSQQIILDDFQTPNNVADNLVYTMMQDSKGFLWFGTMYGLVRYDGNKYITFQNDPTDSSSISFDDVVSLYEDSDGGIWIGTWGGGLNKYDPQTNSFERFVVDESDPNSIPDNIIWAITEGVDKNIFFGTSSNGLVKYNPDDGKFSVVEIPAKDSLSQTPKNIQHLITSENGKIYAATSSGLLEFDPANNRSRWITSQDARGFRLDSDLITAIVEDSENNIWIGTDKGLNKLNPGTEEIVKFRLGISDRVTSLLVDHNQKIWVGTFTGLYKFDPENETYDLVYQSGEPNNFSPVHKLLEDKTNIIWISFYQNGIKRIRNFDPKISFVDFKTLTRIDGDVKINSVVQDSDNIIWIGTSKYGLFRFDRENNDLRRIRIPGTQRDNISVLSLKLEDDQLWIGTTASIYNYDVIRNGFIRIPARLSEFNKINGRGITAIEIEDSSRIWLGTFSSGLFLLRRDERTIEKIDLTSTRLTSSEYILTSYKDRSGNIWFGSYAGLFLLDRNSNSFKRFHNILNDEKSLSNNYVYSIFQNDKNHLWIGTANGLNKFNPETGNFKHYFKKDGLSNDVILSMTGNENGLWLNTLDGLNYLDLNDNKSEVYNENDGLLNNSLTGTILLSNYGRLFIGSNKGLNFFDPSETEENNFNPEIVITGIKLFDENGLPKNLNPLNTSLELDHNQNTIEVELASLDLLEPDAINYSYRFEEDENWRSADNNKILISSLSPDDYKVIFRATNSDGVWSKNTIFLNINISPPFWQTWWFIIGTILIITLLVYLINRKIVNQKIKRVIEIERARTEENELTRRKTAIDFHDELGHRITRISLLSEIIKRKLGHAFSEVIPVLDNITDNANHLYNGTKDFIWSIDPDNDSLYDLMIRLKDFGDEIFGDSNINFEITGLDESYHKTHLSTDWKRHVSLIFKEGMNNSLKYSKGQSIKLGTSFDGETLEMVLEDDGLGIIGEQEKGYGLKNMKRRAKKLNADLKIDSEPGKGTKIYLRGKFPSNSINLN